MSALEDAALAYAQEGLYVFPLQPHGKTPLTAHGLEDATVDPMTIETWWGRWPEANIAIRTGDVVVVDEDRMGALEELAAEVHETIPATGVVKTGSGRHYYFDQPEGERIRNTAGKLAPGIDTRGDGGYVVAPPSVHPDGSIYAWLARGHVTMPDWIAQRIVKQQPRRVPMPDISLQGTTPYGQRALDQEIVAVATAIEGTRNDTLNTAAFALGQLVSGGEIDHHDAYASLTAAARAAGLPQTESTKTIASGFSAGMAEPRQAPETNGNRASHIRVVREAETRPASESLFSIETWSDARLHRQPTQEGQDLDRPLARTQRRHRQTVHGELLHPQAAQSALPRARGEPQRTPHQDRIALPWPERRPRPCRWRTRQPDLLLPPTLAQPCRPGLGGSPDSRGSGERRGTRHRGRPSQRRKDQGAGRVRVR
jgi:hypothetical protein